MKPCKTLACAPAVFAMSLFLVTTVPAYADTAVVDDFTAIADGVFFDILFPPSSPNIPVTGASFGGVTITGTPEITNGRYAFGGATSSPDNPGDGTGYSLWFNALTVTLNFDVPVAAFGVSFTHIDQFSSSDFFSPARLKVYDELNGAGNLLGVVESSGTTNPGPTLIDFVGFWSDLNNIRSAVISRTTSDNVINSQVAVDGYSLSLTPFPEPTTLTLATLALLGMTCHRRKRA